MPGPLDGYRVVDLTAMITGPLATMLLADQGADVVKVEPPGGGDVMRYLSTMRGGMSTMFAACNRSKRSIVVNLREEAGREVVRELAARADVFIQNFRPGVIERLGLSEPVLRARHAGLVYVSLSAFGTEGPYAHRPAYDHILQALTGAPWLQGAESGGRPEYMRMAWCDKVTALVAAQAITAALLARERGRGGQHLRLSMLDASLAFLWPDGYANHSLLETDGVTELPPLSHTYRALGVRDGFVAIAVVTDAQWEGVLRATGRSELRADSRFATAGARLAHLAELASELEAATRDLAGEEVLARLVAADVPCAPILHLEDVSRFEQVVASQALVESRHPALGRLREPRPPARFERTPSEPGRPAPLHGEHGDEILAEFGICDTERASLRAAGVLG